MEKIKQVYIAIQKDPKLLETISEAETPAEGVTRAMPGLEEPNAALKEILGDDVSDEDIKTVMKELEDNNIYKLYKESDGTIDAGELLEYVGDLDGSGISKDNTALRALFDGKLDLKEILLIILLLKLFMKKKQNQTATSSANPLQSLFGTQQTQTVTTTNPLQSLFGVQQQTQTPVYGNNLLSTLLGGGQQTNSNVYTIYGNTGSTGSNSLLSLFGLGGTQNNASTAQNSLINFISGNTTQQQSSPLSSLYSILNQAPSNTVSSSGQINVGTLFTILNALMKNK